MIRRILNIVFFVIGLLFIAGCNGGIEPPEPVTGPTGFAGKITFIGSWPAGITRTHLVVYKNPIVNDADFTFPNLSAILRSADYGSTEFNFISNSDNLFANSEIEPGDYLYVAVVQSRTEFLSLERRDWNVIGVYYQEGNNSSPGVMRIEKNKITQGINIICDFNNPPPQPPGGN